MEEEGEQWKDQALRPVCVRSRASVHTCVCSLWHRDYRPLQFVWIEVLPESGV